MTTALPTDLLDRLSNRNREWTCIGNSTNPVDHNVAEKCILALHDSIGLRRPQIVWVPSPRAAYTVGISLRIAEILSVIQRILNVKYPSTLSHVGVENILRQMPDLNPAVLPHALSADVSALLGDLLAPPRLHGPAKVITDALRETSIPHEVGEVITNRYPEHLQLLRIKRRQARTIASRAIITAINDAALSGDGPDNHRDSDLFLDGWSGFGIGADHYPYDEAFADVVINDFKLVQDHRHQHYLDILRSCPLWLALDGLAVASERPHRMSTDEDGQLHAAIGPAVAYDDGFALHYWHGHAVDPDFIAEMSELTPAVIDKQINAEWRRLMLQHYGVGRYLHDSGATVIDVDQVEVVHGSGTFMPRCLLRDRHGRQYLEGTDGSTQRCYFMSVDPTVTTCRAAHVSISGYDETHCIAQS